MKIRSGKVRNRYMAVITILVIVCINMAGQPSTVNQTSPVTQTSTVNQSASQDELNSMPVINQFGYIQDHSKIYENFRAIREDVFQRLKKNVTDSLKSIQGKISNANSSNSSLIKKIDSLNTSLATTKSNLDEVTKTKESMKLFGMEVTKDTYTTIMMSIFIVLVLILIIGILVFRRNLNAVNSRNKDLSDLRAEFEAYRKTSREAREKMALQHFNELKKLRGE